MNVLSVRSASTTGAIAYGETLLFDFSSDVPAGGQVLAYAVGLAGWTLAYVTTSDLFAENVALLGVKLVPNLVGNQLYVVANALMTDYDGDFGAGPPNQYPPTSAQVTAIAIVGTGPIAGQEVLGNLYGIANGATSPGIDVGENTFNVVFLSGFDLAVTGLPGKISGLSLGISLGLVQEQLTATASASADGLESSGSIDALVLSAPQVVAVLPAIINFSAPDENGLSGTFSVAFDPPAGSSIVQAAVLQQRIDLQFAGGDTHEINLVSAMLAGGLTINGNVVSGAYTLNILNPDFPANTIGSDSSATIWVIAQFSTPDPEVMLWLSRS